MDKRRKNTREKYRKLSKELKRKDINIHAKDKDIFLKSFNFCDKV